MIPFLSVYGHITIDQIVSVGKFPGINESVDVVSKKTSLGGTGANIAIAAARLGVPTALCGFVGPDFPPMYMKEMEDSGLIVDEVVAVPDYETSQAMVINDPDLRQKVIFYQGPQGFASSLGRDLLGNAKLSRKVHFCTGEPKWYIHLLEVLQKEACDVATDPSQEVYRLWSAENIRRAMELTDALFCNSYEAKVIEERLGLGSVFDLDEPLIVRTDGANGAKAKVDGEMVDVPVVKGRGAVDATGCGDSFRAGFYSGLYHGYSAKDSLVLAAAVSSFVIEKVGALTNTPSWEDVEERAKPYLEGRTCWSPSPARPAPGSHRCPRSCAAAGTRWWTRTSTSARTACWGSGTPSATPTKWTWVG